MKKRTLTLIKTAAAILLIIGMALAPMAAADQKRSLTNPEGGIPVPMDRVTIEKKTLETVITNIGDRYKLSKETIIMGLDGRQVSIREMLVPCEADITYDTVQGARIVQRIKMIRIEKDASWQWFSEKPE